LLGGKMNEELRKSLVVPLCCPVCELGMKGDKSNITYYNFGCCSNCFIYFIADGREEKWKGGWRPSEKQLQAMIDELL